ncbi:hypothetical protein MA9V2_111 [Chryseobacterium phage MA9V-2]|nr:hypothetical protein MA9V2_111 [Chryseobacterium phage MA9V-2]
MKLTEQGRELLEYVALLGIMLILAIALSSALKFYKEAEANRTCLTAGNNRILCMLNTYKTYVLCIISILWQNKNIHGNYCWLIYA